MWEVYSFLAWQWWGFFLWFLIAVVVSWFVPGLVLLSYTKLAKSTQFYIAPILGMCLWALQGYVFGWLGVRAASYLLLVGFLFWAYQRRKYIFPLNWKLQLPKVVWVLLFIGVLLQLVPVWGSGWQLADGIKYFFVNIFDGVFHLSLARATVESIPPIQPGAIGLPVTNYHYLSNLVLGELTRVWQLPLNHLYFQYVPTFLSVWLGLLSILLLKKWSNSTWTLIFGLLLFYGVGELSWLVNIFLGGHSPVPFEVFIDHGVVQFVNPPQAFAKLVFFTMLVLFHEFWTNRKWQLGLLIGIMMSTLVGFKVYFGLAAGVGIAAVLGIHCLVHCWQLLRGKNKIDVQKILTAAFPFGVMLSVAFVIGAFIYLPTNASAGGLFFDFLTWPKLLLGFTKLNWNEWWLRLQVYQAAGNTKALVVWYGIAAGIFAVAIYHLRALGFLVLVPRLRQRLLRQEVIFLVVPAFLFTIIGTNFLQTSGGSNSFNFIVVALTILNPLTAVVLGHFAQKKIWAFVAIAAVIVTLTQTVFLQYFFLNHYYHGSDSQTVSQEHQQALEYLEKQSGEVVLQTFPRHYFDETTPYLYFFTGKRTYFGGRGILNSHNQPVTNRDALMRQLFQQDATLSAQLAKKLEITHVLLMRKIDLERNFYLQNIPYATSSSLPHWRVGLMNNDVILLEPEIPESFYNQQAE